MSSAFPKGTLEEWLPAVPASGGWAISADCSFCSVVRKETVKLQIPV